MANIETGVPEAPNDRDDDFPHNLHEHEELHAYARDRSWAWLWWAAVALVIVLFLYFWWGFYAARRTTTPRDTQPIEYPAPPPLK